MIAASYALGELDRRVQVLGYRGCSSLRLLDDVGDADDRRQHYVKSRIEPVAGGAMLDPGSASRSGRALIP
ncbi:MAG: hypothetical protein OXN21_16675 [Chloroflexota bacterium]|nr:hypothetical protein [Chloroflexota bacterium]